MRALMLVGLVAALAVPSTAAAQDPVNIFDTIGITEAGDARNSQIFGEPEQYSLPGEEMPPSRSIVAKGPSDTQDRRRVPDAEHVAARSPTSPRSTARP